MSFLLKAADIAKAVNGQLEGDGQAEVSGAAGLLEATERDLSFFHNPKYGESLQKTRAQVVLIPQQTPGLTLPAHKSFIRVSNPQWAFAQVLGLIERAERQHPSGIHPKAHVEDSAVVGQGTIVYPGVYIGHHVKIGENCLIYPNVVIREKAVIGNRVIIHAGAVVGADGYGFATQGGKHHKIPQIGQVIVEDDVEIGANVTIDRATTGQTRIGAGTKIDNLVHIAHNVQIGENCLIVAQVGISGSTKIGKNVTLAGQVGVVGHLTIGDGAIVAAQSGVMNDVEPGETLFGSPARPHRLSLKLQALYGKLPELYETVKDLKKSLTS